MVKSGQFTDKYKGDTVIALKRQMSLGRQQSIYIAKHAINSKVMWRIVTQYKCGCNTEMNGYFSSSNRAFRIYIHPNFPHDVAGKGVLRGLNGLLPKRYLPF